MSQYTLTEGTSIPAIFCSIPFLAVLGDGGGKSGVGGWGYPVGVIGNVCSDFLFFVNSSEGGFDTEIYSITW